MKNCGGITMERNQLIKSGVDHYYHLPEELEIEILLRLPVVSLLRFKTVCKYWYNVIESSSFVRNHFDHPTNRAHLLFHYPTTANPYGDSGFTIFPEEALATRTLSRCRRDLDRLCFPRKMSYVIGPVNGLFFLGPINKVTASYRLALLNPATRVLSPFPVPDDFNTYDFESRTCSTFYKFGFGCDPLTNDVKVVAFWIDGDHRHGTKMKFSCAIYNLANDSWKHLDIVDTPAYRRTTGVGSTYVNGACYWPLSNYSGLLSFDLGGEVFRVMKGPDVSLSENLLYAAVSSYNGSLAMYQYTNAWVDHGLQQLIHLFAMEEGCWTRYLTIDVSHLRVAKPLGIWKNNNLILETYRKEPGDSDICPAPTQLVLYDPNSDECKEFGIHNNSSARNLVFSYKESLVSLQGGKNKDSEVKSLSDLICDYF